MSVYLLHVVIWPCFQMHTAKKDLKTHTMEGLLLEILKIKFDLL